MTTNAKYSCLKNVFKKAVQEILKKEVLEEVVKTKDSFFSENNKTKDESEVIEKEKVGNEAISEKFENLDDFLTSIKTKFSHCFKEKMAECCVEHKLNLLEHEKVYRRERNKDLNDKTYIKEILESHVADEKENVATLMEEEKNALKEQIKRLDEKINEVNNHITKLNKENRSIETTYKKKFKNKR